MLHFMDIILVRHAKSAHDSTKWKTDAIRPLAAKGRERQYLAARGMQVLGIEYDTIWVSPFLRAQQTLEIIQEVYQTTIDPEIVDDLKVWGQPAKIRDLLDQTYQRLPEISLLLVGHNPNISNLIRLLTGELIEIRTSDIAHVVRHNSEYHLQQYYSRDQLINA